MEKKVIIALMSLASMLPSFANGGYKSAVILMADNSTVGVNLKSDLTFGFVDDKLTITTNEIALEFPLSEVKQWNYSETVAAATSTVEKVENVSRVNRVGDCLILSGLPNASKVMVHDLSGRKLAEYVADGQLTLSLDQYRQSVYLISINGKTLKISK